MESKNRTVNILSVKFNNTSRTELLNTIEKRIKNKSRTLIFTPNPQILLKASRDKSFLKTLQSSDINIPDGIGILIAARKLGQPLKERISGIDVGESLIAFAARKELSVFLLGGKKGRAEKSARRFREKYPTLNICGCHNGYFSKSGEQNDIVVRSIANLRPDILFVCFGSPLQEEWIEANIDRLPSVKLAIGLGGSFDVWSGSIRRAPGFMREAGLEWLWRIIREPRRIKTLYDIPCFLLKIKKSASIKKRS